MAKRIGIGLLIVILVLGGILLGGLGALGLLPWQSNGDLYEDPQGRYSFETDKSWAFVESTNDYAHFHSPSPNMEIYTVVVEANDVDTGLTQVAALLDFPDSIMDSSSIANLGNWFMIRVDEPDDITYAMAGQLVESSVVMLVVKTNEPGINPESATVMRALLSTKIEGVEEPTIESYADADAAITAMMEPISGAVSVTVVHNNEIVFAHAYGEENPITHIPADENTIYPWGSMSKMITATAVMQLWEDGLVDLDESPRTYIPEFPEDWDVTVRQLLTHSACLPNSSALKYGWVALGDGGFPALVDVSTKFVEDYPELGCDPGYNSNYVNTHYLMLGRIVEEVTGTDFETYVAENLFAPMEMSHASFDIVDGDENYAKLNIENRAFDNMMTSLEQYIGLNPNNTAAPETIVLGEGNGAFMTLEPFRVLPPWGGVYSNPTDAAHLVMMHLNDGRYGDNEILKPKTAISMREMQTSVDGNPLGMGLGWWIGEDELGEYRYHIGSVNAGISTMKIYPQHNLGIIVQGSTSSYGPDRMASYIARAWQAETQ